MDGRNRKNQLEELKRLRKEGGTHFKNIELGDEEFADDGAEVGMAGGEAGDSSDYGDAEDLQDFVEDAEPRSAGGKKKIPVKRDLQHRPLANFFKKGPSITASSKKPAKETAASTGDDSYFKKLMQQFDDDESSDSSSESEAENVRELTHEVSKLNSTLPDSFAENTGTLDSTADALADMVPPSEMFTPLDPAILNAQVIKQLEEENWDDFDPNAMEIDEEDARKQKEMESLEDFLKENEAPTAPSANNANSMPDNNMMHIEVEPVVEHMNSLEYSPPENGMIDFYWIDAHERAATGTVYLFGKARQSDGSLVSCCVTVANIQRNLFFLPRENVLGEDGEETGEEVTVAALQTEVSALMARHKVSKYQTKLVTRKYAFEVPDIPMEADWLKVSYGFNSAQLPTGISGRTFSTVFGTNTSALELLLVKRKMMGPCWLRIKPASMDRQGISWCRMELQVDTPKTGIHVIPNGPEAPKLTVMSLSLRTSLNAQHQHEIISASALVFNSVSPDAATTDSSKCNAMFTVVCDPEGVGFPGKFKDTLTSKSAGTRIELAKNEKMLLSYLLSQLKKHDPDVLVGHNFLGFDLGVLLHRMKANGTQGWSQIGRLHWSQWPKAKAGSTESTWSERQILSGRLVCDTWTAARDLVKAKNYSLQTLVCQVLGEPEVEQDAALQVFGQDPTKLKALFASPDSLLKLIRKAEKDAYHQVMLMISLSVLPLTKQLTNIAGNLWSRTLAGARAERNEFLLLHEFHQAKYICPDKTKPGYVVEEPPVHEDAGDEDEAAPAKGKTSGRRKPAYAGGLVLEPKRGFYDKIVLLLDFNSLYPSIIQEYNICFTTVCRDPNNQDELPELPDAGEAQGVLPRVLKGLVEKRAAVKKLMKNDKISPQLLSTYNTRQQALKLTANSMYGCLGFSHSRFYAKPLAMLITSRGRDILQSTVQLTQQSCHLDVLYGDTDSIMVYTGCTDLVQAKRLAQQIKRVVNDRYKLLEIELDGMFEKLLLLRKKKYAALVMEETPKGVIRKLETKGIDMVRRDWCQLSVQASEHILNQMMYGSGAAEEAVTSIHAYLEGLATKAQANEFPLDVFVINKNLTKDPEAYADAKGQPHVTVALRMKQRGLSAKAGDTIPYLICLNSAVENVFALAERAYHPDEVRSNPALSIDVQWYLAQQIHPPVSRLCECVEGTDAARLAMCLGLDSRKYASVSSGPNADGNQDGLLAMSLMSEEERLKNVTRLQLTCTECKNAFEYEGPIRGSGEEAKLGMQCPSCSFVLPPTALYCQTLGLIRSCLSTYHQFWLQCDDPACHTLTRRMRVYESRCTNDSCRGSMRPKVPGSQPYHQLLYLRSLFDWDRARQRLQQTQHEAEGLHLLKRVSAEYEPVRGMILHQLNQCSFPIISLRDIFSFMVAP